MHMPVQAPTASAVDTVGTYLGMRKVSLNRTSPTSPLRIFLNNNVTLQVGLLDQVSCATDRCTHCVASVAPWDIKSTLHFIEPAVHESLHVRIVSQ